MPDNLRALAQLGRDPLLPQMNQLDPIAIEHQLHFDYRKIDLSYQRS